MGNEISVVAKDQEKVEKKWVKKRSGATVLAISAIPLGSSVQWVIPAFCASSNSTSTTPFEKPQILSSKRVAAAKGS